MSGAGPKVTIAGAGALGLASAVALAEAGCTVTVCDPGGGPNASAVAAGMIAPVFEAVLDAVARPHLGLLLAARDLWPGLAARVGVELDRSGALAVGSDPWLTGLAGLAAGVGFPLGEVPTETAQALSPELSAKAGRALMTREDWRIDPPAAIAALTAAAEARGVRFERRSVVGRGDADVLVVATGAGRDPLAPELVELSPIKGHIVRLPWAREGVVVRTDGAYAVPSPGGMAVGATMESGRADTAVDVTKAGPLLAAAARLYPGLAEARYEVMAGVRAATPDGLPMVGWSAEPGVVLATGARRNGWLLAPLVAQVVAACVMGKDAGARAARLDPARFR